MQSTFNLVIKFITVIIMTNSTKNLTEYHLIMFKHHQHTPKYADRIHEQTLDGEWILKKSSFLKIEIATESSLGLYIWLIACISYYCLSFCLCDKTKISRVRFWAHEIS